MGAIFGHIDELVRLAQAALRLRSGDAPPVVIAEAVGFTSLSAFYAGFSQAYGCSPVVFRRQHQFIPA